MNTGKEILTIHIDGSSSMEPVIWCDIDGWGDTVRNQGFPDDPYHFCQRHKADEVQKFMRGELMGYFEGQQELNL